MTQKRPIFAVAPMIDWTDRHCRYFHRQISREALLYTEMVVADAIIHGPRERLLGHDAAEHPLALQLGGSDPAKLADAVQIAEPYGYDEINLNVGCPSDRVQSGTFGACLMLTPETVAECIAAMKRVATVPVTVKCRIGVDEQEPEQALPELITRVLDAGADAIWIHARKAWLKGLSPKENREIPPLDYDIVYRMKQRWPDVFIGINGGIRTLDEAATHLTHVDGVMLGRAAYQNAAILADIDQRFFGAPAAEPDWEALRDRMMAYAERHIASGGRLQHVARHMVGLFTGLPGARRYRQILSTDAAKTGAGPEVLAAAFAAVDFSGTDQEAVSA
ncbi:tRNA dihydrouridine(20/20a) synthase DusA [Rhizobium leguminosarum]|jgi:tRNA-dihydrouridine synthase A|uniref:tRNA-dihydrouridine(20/20a) synthase n=2 Tax=Rhizobium leguminosarum TaxID=384 RepID=A0A6P0D8N6_RHILE|nr:tRNA dihydrouridine(20/20a) synthase DusA [Rhizobium leguminosarum]AVC50356.1 tRNA dihydrouridine synthase A family protein [Rhizobium leguminosarum bv. viciae]MBA8834090.1 tRNA-dihydrouridine synthase A [Rhizobium leguminosarum]MBB4332608.1 tRNA-dihydrouridine synthase A [Rhizobium leguminosarum]MBB4358151.1 tRNA-dihydrouridine synthase A [Rhizobium leguminosarum]MBB4390518.1 tRNA-dihydrouridine synthase A [Rhizobium leguminosarum]